MTREEIFKKNFPQYVTEKGVCLSPFWDLFDAGFEAATSELNKGIIQVLTKENAELKERHAEILEAFASASSGDDFEMAESAREIMEILNIPCYRHGKVVSKLTKAKELLKRLLEEERDNVFWEMNGADKSSYFQVVKQAEQFLKESVE